MGWFGRKQHDEEALSAYLDGELDARQAEIVERHLSTCEACTALLEELRNTRLMLNALPTQAPRRSFVLGAEHARTPARAAAAPRRLPSLALAPAAALAVFVALLFVDLAGNTSSSSDESANTFTAASAPREADDASAGASSAGATGAQPAGAESAAATGPMVDKATEQGQQPGASVPGQDAPAAAGAAQGEEPPAALRSTGPEATPSEGEAAITADVPPAGEPSPEPLVSDLPDTGDGDGVSTLRVLQVLAGAVFLASGLYAFVWPRISRGGS
jgi:anti-sigma factor RsiW